jgi:hypothetical protein
MADTKITALTALTAADPINDAIPIVDVSDTSMAASGTTKRISVNNILGASGTATLASATITGDLTVDTSTLKVDSTNNRVGIGTATPGAGYSLDILGAAVGGIRVSSNNYPNLVVDSANSNGALVFFQEGGTTQARIGHLTGVTGLEFSGNNGTAATNVHYGIDATGISTWKNVGGVAGTAMTLNATSNLVLRGGTAGANGVGLTFPATQVASSDANCLDDYEEGTWTPVFQGTTTNGTYVYSTQVGRYTKVGNLVTVFGHLVISSITLAATGVMRIGGLPFTTSSVNVYAAATVGWTDLITISSGTLALSVNTGGVIIDMYRILSGAGVGFINPSDLVANTRINFTATYFV